MSRLRDRTLALLAAIVLPLGLQLFALRTVLRICDLLSHGGGTACPPHLLALRARRLLARGRGPWTSTCLTRSIVLYAMLRQHGYRPQFNLGVAGGHACFTAHAWVSLADVPLGDPRAAVAPYTRLLRHGA